MHCDILTLKQIFFLCSFVLNSKLFYFILLTAISYFLTTHLCLILEGVGVEFDKFQFIKIISPFQHS